MKPSVDIEWRGRRVEEYLEEIEAADNKPGKLRAIVRAETDDLVKAYLKFRVGLSLEPVRRPGRVSLRLLDAIEQAHAWKMPPVMNSQASMIRAMAIVGRTTAEIATEFDTSPTNIATFLRLFFDTRPLLRFDALLLQVISQRKSQSGGNDTAAEEPYWLRIAYRSGWEVLQSVMFGRRLAKPKETIDQLDDEMTAQLAIRAREFTETRMNSSELGTAGDFRSYLEHKRLRQKAMSEKSPVRNDGNPRERLLAMVVEGWLGRVEEAAVKDARYVALLEKHRRNAKAWGDRLDYFKQHPDEHAKFYKEESAAHDKATEEQEIERATLLSQLKREHPLTSAVDWLKNGTDGQRTESVFARAPHWSNSAKNNRA